MMSQKRRLEINSCFQIFVALFETRVLRLLHRAGLSIPDMDLLQGTHENTVVLKIQGTAGQVRNVRREANSEPK